MNQPNNRLERNANKLRASQLERWAGKECACSEWHRRPRGES